MVIAAAECCFLRGGKNAVQSFVELSLALFWPPGLWVVRHAKSIPPRIPFLETAPGLGGLEVVHKAAVCITGTHILNGWIEDMFSQLLERLQQGVVITGFAQRFCPLCHRVGAEEYSSVWEPEESIQSSPGFERSLYDPHSRICGTGPHRPYPRLQACCSRKPISFLSAARISAWPHQSRECRSCMRRLSRG